MYLWTPLFAMFSSIRTALKRTSRQINTSSMARNSYTISQQQQRDLNIDNSSPSNCIRLKSSNRVLSAIQKRAKSQTSNLSLVTKEELTEFMSVFPDIVRDLTEAEGPPDLPEISKRYQEILHYNVPYGKRHRGLMVVAAYKTMEKERNLTPQNIRLANIMGWCIEMLQGFLLVYDDIVDQSDTRRGNLCWYKKKDVGLNAINDAVMLEQSTYTVLTRHFSNHQCYVPAMELFHDIMMKTALGQCIDCLDPKDDKPILDLYSPHTFNSLNNYKTKYYTFILPVTLAMYMADVYDAELHSQAENVLMQIGQFYQIENDFLDCFGDPGITGKEGTDIREGKCSWLAVVALQRANLAQRKIMEEHYGRPDAEAVRIIKNLYEELDLPNAFAIYKKDSYDTIRTHIRQLCKELPHDFFLRLLDRIYRKVA